MTTVNMAHKRGDTFDYSAIIKGAGAEALDMTGWSGACQVRSDSDDLIEELTFAWLDISKGAFRIRSGTVTPGWPIGVAKFDIEFTAPSGDKVSSQTVLMSVVVDITR